MGAGEEEREREAERGQVTVGWAGGLVGLVVGGGGGERLTTYHHHHLPPTMDSGGSGGDGEALVDCSSAAAL